MWPFRQRRKLFEFWDGERRRRVDPLAVWHDLCGDEAFNIENDPALVYSGNRAATLRMVAGVRRAFGINAWSEDHAGLTQEETLDLFVQFAGYLDALKKNTNSPVTSPLPMEPEPSARSTTSVASDSCSTSNEPADDEPARPSPELEPLLAST